jgi:hypothetical protein
MHICTVPKLSELVGLTLDSVPLIDLPPLHTVFQTTACPGRLKERIEGQQANTILNVVV